jgi:hypothetical protein
MKSRKGFPIKLIENHPTTPRRKDAIADHMGDSIDKTGNGALVEVSTTNTATLPVSRQLRLDGRALLGVQPIEIAQASRTRPRGNPAGADAGRFIAECLFFHLALCRGFAQALAPPLLDAAGQQGEWPAAAAE